MCRKFIVRGKVQGVFFRASTRDFALDAKLQGHAINLPDGSVEVVACGDDVQLAEMVRWLQKGPRHATVTDLSTKELVCRHPVAFTTG